MCFSCGPEQEMNQLLEDLLPWIRTDSADMTAPMGTRPMTQFGRRPCGYTEAGYRASGCQSCTSRSLDPLQHPAFMGPQRSMNVTEPPCSLVNAAPSTDMCFHHRRNMEQRRRSEVSSDSIYYDC